METNLNLSHHTMDEITKQLFNNAFLSDIQFYVSGQLIYAHSLELMKRSVVFQKQLILNLGEIKLIPVEDVEYQSFYEFLKFIYTDTCNVTTTEMGINVLKLAIKYQVLRLENKMIDWLTKEPKCLLFYEFCLMENYLIPLNRVKNKLADSLSDCLVHESFSLIHANVVEEILKLDFIDGEVCEDDLFDCLIHWIETYCKNNGFSYESGRKKFRYLFELVRFATMSIDKFTYCKPKIGSLLSKDDYNMINNLICNDLQCATKWFSVSRLNFNWRTQNQPLIKNSEKFKTNFSVTKDILLIGIWFGSVFIDTETLKDHQLQISAKKTKNQKSYVKKIQCYITEQFSCNLNSLGDLFFLKPNHVYTMEFIYPTGNLNLTVWCRKKNNNIIITDPSNSVTIHNAGANIFEMIFKTPS